LQKYLNLAQLINENSFLIDKKEKYKETRYVIVSHREKSKKIGDRRTEVDSDEDEQENSSNTKGRGEDDSLVNTKETPAADQIKELAHTIQEMKVMIESMAKKHQ
jgi:hypothetical protein